MNLSVMILSLIIFWMGIGIGRSMRPKPLPPREDVDESKLQAFERHMETSIVFERNTRQPMDALH